MPGTTVSPGCAPACVAASSWAPLITLVLNVVGSDSDVSLLETSEATALAPRPLTVPATSR